MSDLRHIHDPVLSSLKMKGIRLLFFSYMCVNIHFLNKSVCFKKFYSIFVPKKCTLNHRGTTKIPPIPSLCSLSPPHFFLPASLSSFIVLIQIQKAACESTARNKCVLSQHTECSQTAHHLPWLGFSLLASSPCDLPYPVIVHCLKRKISYITLNISDSVPFFLLPEAHSDSTHGSQEARV
jgi:hypothetical protein